MEIINFALIMEKISSPQFLSLPIASIELLEDNPRSISDSELKKLCDDIKADPDFLIQRPPLVNRITSTGKIICYAGNQRMKAAKMLGYENIHVWVEDNLSQKVQSERMLKDNIHRGVWDFEKLTLFEPDFLIDVGFSIKDLDVNFGKKQSKDEIKNSLRDNFIVPPFSVLDSRQGYWQDRKKLWLSMGIASHESRENTVTTGTLSGSVPGYYKIKNKVEKTLKREISSKEFEENYLPQYIDDNSQIKQTESGGILSVFDPVLCELMYRWFVPKDGIIFDPFAGGCVRGVIANCLGYPYYGIDLRPDQVEANRKQAEKVGVNPTWYAGDSRNMNELLPSQQEFDFIFSCPPYADLEKYSDDPADLSNMQYSDFIIAYRTIISKSLAMLKDNRFACFVVGDIRDENGFYRNFVSDTIDAFTRSIDAEFKMVKLYNEIIFLNQIGSLPIRVGRQFQQSRKTGKAHQNVLVFYKGDPKAIKNEFPEIKNLEKYLQEKNYEPNIAPMVTG